MTSSSRITSRQNPRVKEAARLRTARARTRDSRFLIDGAREIARAVAAGIRCIEAFVCEELCDSHDCQHGWKALESSGAEMLGVNPFVFAKLAFGEPYDGIVVVAETRKHRLEDLQ